MDLFTYGCQGNRFRDLFKLFSNEPRYRNRDPASTFLRSIRVEARQSVGYWTASPVYTVDQILQDMIDRCKELKLRVAVPQKRARQQAMMMLTVQTMNFLHSGYYRMPL